MTPRELLALPVSVDLPTAGKALGISRVTSYRLAQAGDFPVPVIRVGGKMIVTRASLLDKLGIQERCSHCGATGSSKPVCPTCNGSPPAGFACNTCGESGEAA